MKDSEDSKENVELLQTIELISEHFDALSTIIYNDDCSMNDRLRFFQMRDALNRLQYKYYYRTSKLINLKQIKKKKNINSFEMATSTKKTASGEVVAKYSEAELDTLVECVEHVFNKPENLRKGLNTKRINDVYETFKERTDTERSLVSVSSKLKNGHKHGHSDLKKILTLIGKNEYPIDVTEPEPEQKYPEPERRKPKKRKRKLMHSTDDHSAYHPINDLEGISGFIIENPDLNRIFPYLHTHFQFASAYNWMRGSGKTDDFIFKKLQSLLTSIIGH